MQHANDLSADGSKQKVIEQHSVVDEREETLLALARSGDAAAFATLVVPHRDSILRLVQRVLRSREDADDALQSAILDALRHLDDFQGRSKFSSWLTRIALNAALMRLRTNRRRNEMSLDEECDGKTTIDRYATEARPNPEQEYSRKELHNFLDRALRRLHPIDKDILHLRHMQELSAREAARVLGVPVGTVKARLHRARSRLNRDVRAMIAHPRRSTTDTKVSPIPSSNCFDSSLLF